MKKILLLPLLNSMPSGHHQVADALCESIMDASGETECKKVDLLSEWNSHIESATVKTYLNWIRKAPGSYGWFYRQLAVKTKEKRSFRFYELFFLKKMERLLESEKPDLIICTHAFPSFLINQLKKAGKCSVLCLNVYTDFFINGLWGKSHIDYHFVPSRHIKKQLQQDCKIPATAIFVTGIPVSRQFTEKTGGKPGKDPTAVLISGGSTGLGNMMDMLRAEAGGTEICFNVLCGTNQWLYDKIAGQGNIAAKPFPYISSKEEMNRLYDASGAIVTKPGGVTVSEALTKGLPIFVGSVLPGQEEMNLRFLTDHQLVFQVPEGENLTDFVLETLGDRQKMQQYAKAVNGYRDSLELRDAGEIVRWIEHALINGKGEERAELG